MMLCSALAIITTNPIFAGSNTSIHFEAEPDVQGILQLVPTISTFSPTCANTGANITVDGANFINGGTTVAFNGITSATVTFVSATRVRAIVPAGATTGLITITTSGGSVNSVSNFNLNAAPVVNPSGPTSICLPAQTLNLTSSRTGDEYLWQRSNVDLNLNNITITPTLSGNYRVRVVNGTCTSSYSPNRVVTINNLAPTPSVTPGGPVNLCTGGIARLTSSATTGNQWSNGSTARRLSTSIAGVYSVRVVQGACTTAFSNAVTVNTGATPSVPTLSASGPTTFCAGGRVILYSSSLGDSYIWQRNNANIVNVADSLIATLTGNYRVRVITGACTSAFSANTSVTANTVPTAPSITPAGPLTLCGGASAFLRSNRTSGNIWSTGATTQQITVLASGSYSVRQVTNGCTSNVSNTVVVSANPIPAAPTISANGPTTICAGGSLQLTSSALSGNLWGRAAAPTTVISTNRSFSPTSTASYFARVVVSGCTSLASNQIAVTVNTVPAVPTIVAQGPITFCLGGNVGLQSSRASGNLWSTGQTIRTISPTTTGTYTVRGVNANCTTAASLPVKVVVVAPAYIPPVIGRDEVCPGDFRPYTSDASLGYLWNNGSTDSRVFVFKCQGPDTTINLRIALPACTSGIGSKTLVKRAVPTAPTVTPASGTYGTCVAVTVTNTSPGATLLYALGGYLPVLDPPNSFTKTYTTSVGINATNTFRARALANGCLSSPVARFLTIQTPCTVSAPIITPATGVYEGSRLVSMSTSTAGATIYYTTGGNSPVIGNPLTRTYTGPFWLTTPGEITIKAIAVFNAIFSSQTINLYVLNNTTFAATPVFSPVAGNYVGATPVSISSTSPGAVLYWTNNGTTPVVGSPLTNLYTGPINVTSNAQLKAVAIAAGLPPSVTAVANYNITQPLPAGDKEAIARKSVDSEITLSASAVVFPNPSQGIFNLQVFNPDNSKVSYSVIDLQGKVLQSAMEMKGENVHKTIDLTNQSGNMFFIRLMIGDKTHNFKLTKN